MKPLSVLLAPLQALCLPGVLLLTACAPAPPQPQPPASAEVPPASRQPVDPRHNKGTVVYAPATRPEPIDSTLLLDRENASVSLRAVLGRPQRGKRTMPLREYKLQFRNAGSGAVAISEVVIQASAGSVPVELGSVVVPTGKGYTLSVDRRVLAQIDPREDAFLTFRYEGRRFQALIHGHQLIYVVEAPG